MTYLAYGHFGGDVLGHAIDGGVAAAYYSEARGVGVARTQHAEWHRSNEKGGRINLGDG
jgi:hypothetical protein